MNADLITERTRRALFLADEEARNLGHYFVEPEHILLGLFTEGEGIAARVLESLEISRERLLRAVLRVDRPANDPQVPTPERLPLTRRSQEALAAAEEEADLLGHRYVGTEHLLLGLARAGQHDWILEIIGYSAEEVRRSVEEALRNQTTPAQPNGSDRVRFKRDSA